MAKLSQAFLSSLGRPAMTQSLFDLGTAIGNLPQQRQAQKIRQANAAELSGVKEGSPQFFAIQARQAARLGDAKSAAEFSMMAQQAAIEQAKEDRAVSTEERQVEQEAREKGQRIANAKTVIDDLRFALESDEYDSEKKSRIRGYLITAARAGEGAAKMRPAVDALLDNTKPDNVVQVETKDGESFSAFLQGGKFYNLRGENIELDPEDRVIETTSLSGSEGDLGLTSTEVKELRSSEIAALNFVDTAEEALNMLENQPDVNTFIASAGAIVNDIQQEALAVGRSLGVEIDESLIAPSRYEGAFDRLGIDSRRMQSMITSLAYQAAAASGQSGRAVSDKDVERFIKEIGSAASDPRTFSAVLRDASNRAIRRVKNEYRVKNNEEYSGPLLGREYKSVQTTIPAGAITDDSGRVKMRDTSGVEAWVDLDTGESEVIPDGV